MVDPRAPEGGASGPSARLSERAAPGGAAEGDDFLDGLPRVGGARVVGPVKLEAKISKGGMGVVYRGHHQKLDIDVAVKFLFPHLATHNPEYIVRFEREARIAAQINSENLVRVFAVDSEKNYHYVVMELVCGETARERVQRKGPLAVEEAMEILLGAARGLEAAHRRGVVHRDIKPENIMIDASGIVKLADLGIAKIVEGADAPEVEITQTGFLMGTPSYMPPEQFQDPRAVGPSGDIYSMGATLYFLLAGKPPYSGTIGKIYKTILDEGFPDLRKARRDVPPEVLQILSTCVRRNPGARYPNASALLDDLHRTGVRRLNLSDGLAGTACGEGKVSTPPSRRVGEIHFQVTEEDRRGAGRGRKRGKRVLVLTVGLLLIAAFAGGAYLAVQLARPRTAAGEGPPVTASPPGPNWSSGAVPSLSAVPSVKPSAPERATDVGEEHRAAVAEPEIMPRPAPVPEAEKPVAARVPEDTERPAEKSGSAATRPEADLTAPSEERLKAAPPAIAAQEKPAPPRGPESVAKPQARVEAKREPEPESEAEMEAWQRLSLCRGRAAGPNGLLQLPLSDLSACMNPLREFLASFPSGRHGEEARSLLERYQSAGWARDLASRDQVQAATAHGLPVARQLDLGEGVTLKFLFVPPGEFRMGEGEESVEVTMTRGFYLSIHEVTRRAYRRVAGGQAAETRASEEDDAPVTDVSFGDAEKFCRMLSTGRLRLRLPTEAEWEYACRAGTIGSYSWGAQPDDAQLWYWRNSNGKPHPVGKKGRNGWGLFDMPGNVREWCADWYGPYPTQACQDPVGPGAGTYHVVRGGSFNDSNREARSQARCFLSPGKADAETGFRVVLLP